MLKDPHDIETVSQQGSGRENEDALVLAAARGLYAVVDGATALAPGPLTGRVAAAAVASALQECPDAASLVELLASANARIAAEVIRILSATDDRRSADDLAAAERSSCGVILVRLSEPDRLDFVHAGDCMAFLRYRNGAVRALTWDRIAALDAAVVATAHAEAVRRLGGSAGALPEDEIPSHLAALREHVLPILRRNRGLLNTAGGYGALDGTSAALERLEHGSVDIGAATAVLLLSDGLQLPDAACPEQDAWVASATYAFEHGLQALLDRMNELEASDRACFRYPRLKFADDKSGILIRL